MSPDARLKALQLLRRGDWFGGLPTELQEMILARAQIKHYARGQVISLEGTQPAGLVVVLEGRARMVRHVGLAEEVILYVAEPGFWMGEIAVLARLPTAVSIVASAPTRLLRLATADFEDIVERHPRLYRDFALLAIQRYATVVRFLAESTALSAAMRLRQRLAAMAERRHGDMPASGPCVLQISQTELAHMIGISRQRLGPLLRGLESEGAIRRSTRSITVLDAQRLLAPAPP